MHRKPQFGNSQLKESEKLQESIADTSTAAFKIVTFFSLFPCGHGAVSHDRQPIKGSPLISPQLIKDRLRVRLRPCRTYALGSVQRKAVCCRDCFRGHGRRRHRSRGPSLTGRRTELLFR